MASETSSKNRILLIAVPTIGLAVILYYSGLLGFVTYYVEELMYVILNDIPRFHYECSGSVPLLTDRRPGTAPPGVLPI